VNLHTRVFPEFMTHTQANGRWSIVKPALQQLPGDLSDIYVPDVGKVWMKHDWDAVELRIQGAIANDKPLLDVFANLKIRHESETTIRRRSNHYASNGIKSLYREGGYCGVAWNGDGDR